MFYLLQRDCHRNPTELGTSSEAALELRNGDDDPNAARRARWSGKQPVSNLGAWRNAHGQQEIDKAFTNLGVRFPDRTFYQFDLQTTDVAGHMTYPGRWSTAQPRLLEGRAPTRCALSRSNQTCGWPAVAHRLADTATD